MVRPSKHNGGKKAAKVAVSGAGPMCPLLQLSPELLQLVWVQLSEASNNIMGTSGDHEQGEPGPASQPHQHALQSTCTAARQATSALIGKLRLHVECQEPSEWQSALQQGSQALARFPRLSTLRQLELGLRVAHHSSVPLLLPGLLFQARGRLASVLTLELKTDMVRVLVRRS